MMIIITTIPPIWSPLKVHPALIITHSKTTTEVRADTKDMMLTRTMRRGLCLLPPLLLLLLAVVEARAETETEEKEEETGAQARGGMRVLQVQAETFAETYAETYAAAAAATAVCVPDTCVATRCATCNDVGAAAGDAEELAEECGVQGFHCEYNATLSLAAAEDDGGGVSCNGTLVELCPQGYWCDEPFDEPQRCTKGHLCREGSHRPYPCAFARLSCPNEEMTSPQPFWPFIVMILVYVGGGKAYMMLWEKYQQWSERVIEPEKVKEDAVERTKDEQRMLERCASRMLPMTDLRESHMSRDSEGRTSDDIGDFVIHHLHVRAEPPAFETIQEIDDEGLTSPKEEGDARFMPANFTQLDSRRLQHEKEIEKQALNHEKYAQIHCSRGVRWLARINRAHDDHDHVHHHVQQRMQSMRALPTTSDDLDLGDLPEMCPTFAHHTTIDVGELQAPTLEEGPHHFDVNELPALAPLPCGLPKKKSPPGLAPKRFDSSRLGSAPAAPSLARATRPSERPILPLHKQRSAKVLALTSGAGGKPVTSQKADSSPKPAPAGADVDPEAAVGHHHDDDLSSVDTTDLPFDLLDRQVQPYNISLKNLTFRLHEGKRTILQSVTARVRAGVVTALMGPSGAGKTTLQAVLRGRAHYGETSGVVTVNGNEVDNLGVLDHEMSFAPQEDVCYGDLTTQENVYFTALLLNRRGWTTGKQVMPMVNSILRELGLEHIRHTIVGGGGESGISGGQRKRLSIALELVKEPSIFFLDEPTSGLDAATSISVLSSLHALAGIGVSVIATIHQPRVEIFSMLDDLILLAPGGRTVYASTAAGVMPFFEQCGFTPLEETNPADFIMDVLAGFVPREDEAEVVLEEVHDILVSTWANVENSSIGGRGVGLFRFPSTLAPQKEPDFSIKMWLTLNWCTFWTVFRRGVQRYHRRLSRQWIDLCIMMFTGAIISQLFQFPGAKSEAFFQQVSGVQLSFGILTMQVGLRTFGDDRLMRLREESAGIKYVPYFFGKLLSTIHNMMLLPFAYLCGWWCILETYGTMADYWVCLVGLAMSLFGLAHLIALNVPANTAGVVANAVVVIGWGFGGVSVSKEEIVASMGPLGRTIYELSPFKYSMKLQVLAETKHYSDALDHVAGDASRAQVHVSAGAQAHNFGVLVEYAVLTAAAAMVFLLLSRNHYELVYKLKLRAWEWWEPHHYRSMDTIAYFLPFMRRFCDTSMEEGTRKLEQAAQSSLRRDSTKLGPRDPAPQDGHGARFGPPAKNGGSARPALGDDGTRLQLGPSSRVLRQQNGAAQQQQQRSQRSAGRQPSQRSPHSPPRGTLELTPVHEVHEHESESEPSASFHAAGTPQQTVVPQSPPEAFLGAGGATGGGSARMPRSRGFVDGSPSSPQSTSSSPSKGLHKKISARAPPAAASATANARGQAAPRNPEANRATTAAPRESPRRRRGSSDVPVVGDEVVFSDDDLSPMGTMSPRGLLRPQTAPAPDRDSMNRVIGSE